MHSQFLYQQDPTVLEFDAQVVENITLSDGRTGAVLDRTYFYPTGGGQEHDSGELGSARVVDVLKDENNDRLVHVVEGDISLGAVKARIDAGRRLRHMQNHTAQHLLTQCLLRQTGFETVSANINGYSPSTLDIVTPQVSQHDLEQAELTANQLIYENKPVRTYFVTPEELKAVPLRRPPKVTENIRIVEIDGFDYSPCGGTHVAHTGSIGMVKVLKAERQNEKIRIYFVAGVQAFEMFQHMYEMLNRTAAQVSTSWQEIPELFTRQAEQLSLLQKELQVLRQVNLSHEAQELAVKAQDFHGIRLVKASFENRTVGELRLMAEEFKQIPDLVGFLSSFDGQKLSLVITCGEASGKDARQLLVQLLSTINGRGGGDARLAQGGGSASSEQARDFLQHTEL